MSNKMLPIIALLTITSNAAKTFGPSNAGTTFGSNSGDLSTFTNAGISWSIEVGETTTTATVIMKADRYFGFGFGVQSMTNLHAVLFNTDGINVGAIEERDYTGRGEGSVSATSQWNVDSFDAEAQTFTFVVSRPNTVTGGYTFDPSASTIDFVAAMGANKEYVHHGIPNRIYGSLAGVAGPTTNPTPQPTNNPLQPGQTAPPTANPTTTASPSAAPTADDSKGVRSGCGMIWMFVIGIVYFL